MLGCVLLWVLSATTITAFLHLITLRSSLPITLACPRGPIRVASRPHYPAWAHHLHIAFKRVVKSSAIEKRGVPWRQAARRRLPSAPPRLCCAPSGGGFSAADRKSVV